MRDHVALSRRALPALALVLLAAPAAPAAPRDPAPSVDGFLVVPRPQPAPAPAPKASRKDAKGEAAPEPPPLPPAADAVAQARALRDAGKPADAEALLRPYLDVEPVDPDVRAELAGALSDQSRDTEAVAQLERVVRARPDDDDARLRLGDLYAAMDEPDSALEHLQAVLAKRPADPSLRRRVGLLLVDVDRGAEAIPHLEAYSELVPGDDEVLGVLESLYRWNDRPDKALRLLERRVEAHPDDIDAVRDLAGRWMDQDAEGKAIPLYLRVVKARPDDLDARRTLGELYEWTDRPRQALEQYEAYLEKRPYDNEIRARSLSLSSDLGLGSDARRHGYYLRSSDPRFQGRAREALLADTGFGTWAGVQYDIYHERNHLLAQRVGPRAQYRLNDAATIGAWYQFRHLRGQPAIVGRPWKTVMGHAIGVFSNLSLPAGFGLSLGASYAHYDTGFDSGGGHVRLSRDFGPVSLSLQFERADLLSSVGDVQTRIVANDLSLTLDAEPIERLLLSATGTWGMYSDRNQRMAAEAGIGWRAIDSPRLEFWYEYGFDHFRYTDLDYPTLTYFAPDAYHHHGPTVSLLHAATTWFAYGIDVHLWHVYDAGQQAVRLQYGGRVIFRPALHHRIEASYERNDDLWNSVPGLYQSQQGLFTYAYEF